jgi:AAA domain
MTSAQDWLASRGWVEPELTASWDVYIARDNKGRLRAWVPWKDAEGKVLYETGRLLGEPNNGSPKWYHRAPKGELSATKPALFATPGAWEARSVVLVESHADALAWGYAGHPAFATAGASQGLKSEAIKALQAKDEITLVTQNDKPLETSSGPDSNEVTEKNPSGIWLDSMLAALQGALPRLYVAHVPDLPDTEDSAAFLKMYGANALEESVFRQRKRVPGSNRRLIRGAEVLSPDESNQVALWGDTEEDILWASGETLILTGPIGIGKTTLAQQLILARAGMREPDLLGYPVAVDERPIFYIAADRYKQAFRSFRRMLAPDDKPALDEHYIFHKGPPDVDLAFNCDEFVEWVLAVGPGTLVVDSLKDVARGLVNDDVGSGYTRAVNRLMAEDIELIILAHPRKNWSGSKMTTDDIYGSMMIAGNAGSVIAVEGIISKPQRTLRTLKSSAGWIDMKVSLDFETGRFCEQQRVDDVMLMILKQNPQGMTVAELAKLVYQGSDRKHRVKTSRGLQELAGKGLVIQTQGDRLDGHGRTPDLWLAKGN